MELTIYDVIKGTISTPKSLELRQKYGKITFHVHNESNKIMVREAVEKIWDVKVADVKIINLHGKQRKASRKSYTTATVKKAIVSLKSGYKIDLPDQFESMGAAQEPSKAKSAKKREGGE